MLYLFLTGFMLLPLAWVFFGVHEMRRHVRKVISEHQDIDSQSFEELKVHFRNFDIQKKKNKWDLSTNDPIYQFYSCDLIFNRDTILLLGRRKGLFGTSFPLNATVLIQSEESDFWGRIGYASIKQLRLTESHVEIEFRARNYEQFIVAVIRINKTPGIKEFIYRWQEQNFPQK